MATKKKKNNLNVFLWVLQVILALYNLIGGYFLLSNFYLVLNPAVSNWPGMIWMLLAALQIIFAIGIVLPKPKAYPNLTVISAIGITIISLLGTTIYSAYTGFPGILWSLVPAAMAGFVAYKRK